MNKIASNINIISHKLAQLEKTDDPLKRKKLLKELEELSMHNGLEKYLELIYESTEKA